MIILVVVASKLTVCGGRNEGWKLAGLLSLLLAGDGEKDGLSSSDSSSVGMRKEREDRGGLLSCLWLPLVERERERSSGREKSQLLRGL